MWPVELISRAIAELASPSARTAQVGFECGWTAVMSILQLGKSVICADFVGHLLTR